MGALCGAGGGTDTQQPGPCLPAGASRNPAVPARNSGVVAGPTVGEGDGGGALGTSCMCVVWRRVASTSGRGGVVPRARGAAAPDAPPARVWARRVLPRPAVKCGPANGESSAQAAPCSG